MTTDDIDKPSKKIKHPTPVNQADELLSAFVGDQYNRYYRNKWFKGSQAHLNFSKIALSLPSFNLAGLIFNIAWLCYRRMIIYAALYLSFVSLIDVMLMHVLGRAAYNELPVASYFIFGVILAFFCNHIYLYFSIKQVNKALAQSDNIETAKAWLIERGGTSLGSAIGGTLLILIISAILRYMLAPNWYG
ncbi:hypothetical protein [Psychrobacter sp. FDAARGOS_221]|uniref:hypothetical protein n=1 Tax=Psychrobacter sp. FDAARGOS_221 TaxID=1975705 RepID=UPI000BB563A0|nr:hypothetical protein [Psychrobacter sp. FDAARGOS_221]PNK60793.1 hypothetical protein A6J60_007820 [Psychrobacter sp. FDAARGOS_221]